MNIQTKIKADDAYHADFTAWLLKQAQHLRAREADALDWDNLAEEIEDMGKSEFREVESRLRTILVHLLKLGLSRTNTPRGGWIETVQTQRNGLEAVLRDSPSLRPRAESALPALYDRAKRDAIRALVEYEPVHADAIRADVGIIAPIAFAQAIDPDWFPTPPVA